MKDIVFFVFWILSLFFLPIFSVFAIILISKLSLHSHVNDVSLLLNYVSNYIIIIIIIMMMMMMMMIIIIISSADETSSIKGVRNRRTKIFLFVAYPYVVVNSIKRRTLQKSNEWICSPSSSFIHFLIKNSLI